VSGVGTFGVVTEIVAGGTVRACADEASGFSCD
jgi:hypothetical protein